LKPDVQAALNDFVFIELYTDTSDDAHNAKVNTLRTTYGAAAIPFYQFLAPDGTKLGKVAGLIQQDEFLKTLADMKAKSDRVARR
jgi:thiol:disulfide interchange protein